MGLCKQVNVVCFNYQYLCNVIEQVRETLPFPFTLQLYASYLSTFSATHFGTAVQSWDVRVELLISLRVQY